MKRNMVFLILFLIIIPLPISSQESSLSDLSEDNSNNPLMFTTKEVQWLQSKPTLTYVYDPDWPPFEWTNAIQEHIGIIPEILAIISDKTGIIFKPVRTNTWDEAVKLAEANKVDMYSAVAVTMERSKYLNFTTQNIYSYLAIFVSDINNNEFTYDESHNLRGKKIALIKGNLLSATVEKNNPGASYIYVDSAQEGFNKVRNKEADLFAINAATGTYFINHKGYSDIKIYKKIDYVFELKIALQKHIPLEALSVIDKALLSIDKDQLSQIFNKWTVVRIHKESNIMLITGVVFFSALIIIFILYFNRHLKSLAYYDSLTGLPNRRLLIDRIQQAIPNSIRNKKSIAVCFIDLDGFKAVNDVFGHQAGDRILIEVAERMKKSLRSGDTFARIGGDEFVLLLIDISDTNHLNELLDRILKILSADYQLPSNITKEKIHTISVSIGLSLCPKDGSEGHILLRNADRAMYIAKHSGKNCYKYFEKSVA